MALTLRRIRVDSDEWDVLDNGRAVGRLYQAYTELIWRWSITEYVDPRSGLRTSGMTQTFDAAKAAFGDTWDQWRAWATKNGFNSGAG